MTSERSLITRSTEPLVAILLEEDGQELVRYFPEGVADAAMTDDVTRAGLAAIGACRDLDWDSGPKNWTASDMRVNRHRRQLRPPHGRGLIGDFDTLIAATALTHDLTLITADGDFVRVPRLKAMLLECTPFFLA